MTISLNLPISAHIFSTDQSVFSIPNKEIAFAMVHSAEKFWWTFGHTIILIKLMALLFNLLKTLMFSAMGQMVKSLAE